MRATIAADIASVPAHPDKKLTSYYELDPTYYSLTSATFVGSLLKSLGVVNIADAESTTRRRRVPAAERRVHRERQPQDDLPGRHRVLQGRRRAKVAKRPGFAKVSAVVDGHVVNLNDDVASRWGPRLGLLMNQLTAAVKKRARRPALWK